MNLDDLIIATFCELDDAINACLSQLPKTRLRQRGSQPTLCDSEVLTIEVIGAYLGLEQDSTLYSYFVRHYSHFFPLLPRIHRTTFTRQAANLCHFKERLWQHWLHDTLHHHDFGLLDSMPLPVCRFARATFCRRFRCADVYDLQATYGYDHVARQTFWGLRLHFHVAWPGLITRLTLAPAHQSDIEVAPQMLQEKQGIVIGDRNYHAPDLQLPCTRSATTMHQICKRNCSRKIHKSSCWRPSKTKNVILTPNKARCSRTFVTASKRCITSCAAAFVVSRFGRVTPGICSIGCYASYWLIPCVFGLMCSLEILRSNLPNSVNKLAHRVN
jgi:hypothetical protein